MSDMIAVPDREGDTPLGSHRRGVFPEPSARLPRALESEWDWQLQGRCRTYPSQVFFPDDDRGKRLRDREEDAKRVCRGCPVLEACRRHALSLPEQFGVWGAMTARERARVIESRAVS
jgi:WhiB family transcriptional regulator, redox-sensing transcriptional regulator